MYSNVSPSVTSPNSIQVIALFDFSSLKSYSYVQPLSHYYGVLNPSALGLGKSSPQGISPWPPWCGFSRFLPLQAFSCNHSNTSSQFSIHWTQITLAQYWKVSPWGQLLCPARGRLKPQTKTPSFHKEACGRSGKKTEVPAMGEIMCALYSALGGRGTPWCHAAVLTPQTGARETGWGARVAKGLPTVTSTSFREVLMDYYLVTS